MQKEKFRTPPSLDELHRFIQKFNFATFVSQKDMSFQVTHIPVLLNPNEGKYGTLIGHMAKVNPHAAILEGSEKFLVIFQGPHAYISPSWYHSVPNVPTWNYAAVHVQGSPIRVSEEELSKDLSHLVKIHENKINPNQEYVIPEDYRHKLIQHIVGFKMEILEINGKFKLGQHRSQQDWDGVLQGLRQQNTSESFSLAEYMNDKS